MKMKLVTHALFAILTLASNAQAQQSSPVADAQTATAKLLITITSNAWSYDNLHVIGSLNRSVVNNSLTFVGYDANQKEFTRSDTYLINNGTFNASLSDPARQIRFVKVIEESQSLAVATPSSTLDETVTATRERWLGPDELTSAQIEEAKALAKYGLNYEESTVRETLAHRAINNGFTSVAKIQAFVEAGMIAYYPAHKLLQQSIK